MASISRASLPEEFYDITSDMLLAQPEPQYLYGTLWLGAMGASLSDSVEGLPFRPLPSAGAEYSSADRDRLMLANPMVSDLIAAKVDFKALPGNTVRINRPSFANTTYTEASRKIAIGTSISTTQIGVASQQVNLTLARYGGPYSSAVQPLGIESFDAAMSVHKLASIAKSTLVRDFHKFVDAVQVALLDTAATAVYPEGMSAVNDATATGSFPMTYEQINNTEAQMDTANLPTFADGFRALVITPVQAKQLKDDPQFQRYAVNFAQFNALFPSYLGSIGKFHVFKSTTLSITNNGSSVPIHYGHAIAPGALLGGMGRKPSVRPNSDDNYGETVKVIWLADLAFGLANNAFVYSVRSSA